MSERDRHDDSIIAALAGLPSMTPARLASLLGCGSPSEALDAVRTGRVVEGAVGTRLRDDPLGSTWRDALRRRPPSWYGERLAASNTSVCLHTDPSFPPQLLEDPRRPAALFVRGDPAALHGRRVGVVGTRNATRRGRQTAARLGSELADAGVAVVSGLALGVDAAAHRGALAVLASPGPASRVGPPVAVVGSGTDVVYPRRHAELWGNIVDHGLLLSEWPPGVQPDPFRFPLRNRLIAALSEVLVVVESRERGGSLITAREAASRGVDVFAVPGAVDSPASVGTNLLLRDGAATFTDTADVLVALGLDTRRAGRSAIDTRPRPVGIERSVLVRCVGGPATLEGLAAALGESLSDTALALARLEGKGWVREISGWFEVCDEYADVL